MNKKQSLLVSSLLIACVILLPSTDSKSASLREPSEEGTFLVGWKNVTIQRDDKAPANATIWYPAESFSANATPCKELAPYPVIIFAPGRGADRWDYEYLACRSASWGYCFLGVNFNESAIPNAEECAKDYRFAVDWLVTENLSENTSFYKLFDISKLVACGHSLGGGIAVVATYYEHRISAVIALAPYVWWYYENVTPLKAADELKEKPFEIIVGEKDYIAERHLHADILYQHANTTKYEYVIVDEKHFFTERRKFLFKYFIAFLNYYIQKMPDYYIYLFGSNIKEDENNGYVILEYDLKDSSPPTFDGIGGIEKHNSYLRIYWGAATDKHPPIMYKIYISKNVQILEYTHPECITSNLSYNISTKNFSGTYYFAVRSCDIIGNEDKNSKQLSIFFEEGGEVNLEPGTGEPTHAVHKIANFAGILPYLILVAIVALVIVFLVLVFKTRKTR